MIGRIHAESDMLYLKLYIPMQSNYTLIYTTTIRGLYNDTSVAVPGNMNRVTYI